MKDLINPESITQSLNLADVRQNAEKTIEKTKVVVDERWDFCYLN
jgi:hypothetical protein